jgi:hypothetical protein
VKLLVCFDASLAERKMSWCSLYLVERGGNNEMVKQLRRWKVHSVLNAFSVYPLAGAPLSRTAIRTILCVN